MAPIRSGASRVAAACLAALALGFLSPATPAGISSNIVISQVYGGGGNSGATLTNDFIELFNRGDAPVSVDGWSVQYASSSGSTWQVTPLSGTIPAGGYYLVQQARGSGGTEELPLPDATGSIAMAAASGKVALANSTSALSGTCPTGGALVDFVGFGSANCSETATTPNLSNTTAAVRRDAGCLDTDNNSLDFATGAPAPRNSATPPSACTGPPSLTIDDVSVQEGQSGASSATFTVSLSAPAPPGGVSFDIATSDDTATAPDDYQALSLTGQLIAGGDTTYAFTVAINGDTAIEPNESFFVEVTNIVGANVADAQGRGTILTDDFAIAVRDVVISQVYGGGGNSGAPLTHDFVELFNRESTPVNLAGWSVQYASSGGTNWLTAPLTGTIAPGGYFLVQLAGGANGVALPAADATGTVNMSGSSGKIALVAGSSALAGACPTALNIADFVGFGSSATCFEGSGATSNLSNTTAAHRRRGGCVDSNDNRIDFSIATPAPRNSATATLSCDLIFTAAPIHAIQGDGPVSPFLGQDVSTTGIVTGLKSNGFFIQTPDAEADANPLTSQGLFVFTGTLPAIAVGDAVSVKGTAGEFFNLTQVESVLPGDVTVVSSGFAPPTAVTLTTAILDPAGMREQLERFEGMRLTADSLTSVAPTNGFGEIQTVLNGVSRPMREPGIEAGAPVPPDPVTGAIDNVDRWDLNPERIVIDTDGLLNTPPLYVTSKVTLSGVTGPLDFSFGEYKILPATTPVASANLAAMAAPAPAPNEFAIAGYNIENFVGDPLQRQKAALNIREVMQSPDIIGVVEVASEAALQALADEVNAATVAAGGTDPQYVARLIPFGSGQQHVGFLVKSSRVLIHQVTQERASDTFVNPANGNTETLHDRPPLVLDATVDPGGANPGRVIVVVNHLRSFIDVELLTPEGERVRAKRRAQAEAIAQLLQDLQSANPNVPVISVGDYNAYQFSDGYTDPMSVLKGEPTPGDRIVVEGSPDLVDPNFENLTDTLPRGEQYTFIFEGTPQALDHVLVNDVARAYLQRYVVARSNADFPDHVDAGFATNPARPEAHSDHDAPIAYFAFPGTPVVTLQGSATMTVEAYTSFVDPGATAHDDTGPLPVTVSGAVDVQTPGTYVLEYTASNRYATTTVRRTVIVSDTIAPAIGALSVTPSIYDGPPNHKMFPVGVHYEVTDASGSAACALSVEASGDQWRGGNDGPDWIVLSAQSLLLRAERGGGRSSRIYTVTVTCTDLSGNAASQSATVTIAHPGRGGQ